MTTSASYAFFTNILLKIIFFLGVLRTLDLFHGFLSMLSFTWSHYTTALKILPSSILVRQPYRIIYFCSLFFITPSSTSIMFLIVVASSMSSLLLFYMVDFCLRVYCSRFLFAFHCTLNNCSADHTFASILRQSCIFNACPFYHSIY